MVPVTLPKLPIDLSPESELATRLDLAWEIGHLAAQFLLSDRPSDLAVLTKSTSTDLVSAMDQQSERLIVDRISAAFPDDSLLGEEGAHRIGTSEYKWVIDPLDGTVNYLFGIPLWGVSIGIEIGNSVVAGVVVIPAQGESFVAARGHGSWKIDHNPLAIDPICRNQIRNTSDIASALVSTGFAYSAERRKAQARVVQGIVGDIADIRRSGAAVVDLCWLACGRTDAYFEYGLNPWDLAAGSVIVREAGGRVGGLTTDDPTDMMLASCPGIYSRMQEILIHAGAPDIA